MMLGNPSTAGHQLISPPAPQPPPPSSNDSADAAAEAANDSGGGDSGGELGCGGAGGGGTAIQSSGGFNEDYKGRLVDELGERGSGGNRWPRQETLALLRIRSDMDATFRDSSLKGPLWEEVSRKMAELGYHRTAKKCKEKFENVFKYHKRTREGRASKADGKTYRFFDQLEAFEANPSAALQLPPTTPTPRPPPLAAFQMQPVVHPVSNPPPPTSHHHHTVSSAPLSPNPVSFAQNLVSSTAPNNLPPLSSLQPPPTTANAINMNPPLHHHFPASHVNVMASMLSNSSSSSTSSDEDIERRHGRKRKWKDYFERLMKDVIVKQEELQKKFLESLEKRERDRMIREEAWRVQEMARMNREHDLLVQERSMAAAKDAAVIAFLQKITDQQNQQNPNGASNPIQLPVQLLQVPNKPPPSSAPPPAPPPAVTPVQIPPQSIVPVSIPTAAATPAPPPPPPTSHTIQAVTPRNMEITPKSTTENGIQNYLQPSPSRWPKAEVQALINLRTNLDIKYQENGPKGPLWEEISAGMRKLGYSRNAKRCKEKWENINKYFKKVKESNKKRPEDSKTCPYFQQLDALYKEKAKIDTNTYNFGGSSSNVAKPETSMAPILAMPEQQWPLQQENQQQKQQLQDSAMEEDPDSENMEENDHDDDGDDEDEEDEGGGYEIVTNKQPSSMAASS